MKLLYFASSSFGGLADYAREQIAALKDLGVSIEVLCPSSFPRIPRPGISRHDRLADPVLDQGAGRLARGWRFMRLVTGHHRELARTIAAGGHRHVLLGAFAEYFAPFWSPALRALARKGVVFGAVVHDPVRDAVLGPAWWHRRSIAAAYSFLRHAFVHESVLLETFRPVPGLEMTVIPHGPYLYDTEIPSRAAARQRLGLPPDAPVLLAFGHIRDNKNLHLTIEAMRAVPDLHLLVAGNELSAGQRPGRYYQDLARAHGVDGRCRWHVRFIPEREIGVFFAASDLISLTYARSFRSASGVLSAAARFRLPCVASSGAGPLRTLVCRYGLGVWVEPDDAERLAQGLRQLLAGEVKPRWDDYLRDNSWAENARIVARSMFSTVA